MLAIFSNQSIWLEQNKLQIYPEIRHKLELKRNYSVLSFCPFSDAAWLPYFSTNQYGLSKSCRGTCVLNYLGFRGESFYSLGILLPSCCRSNTSCIYICVSLNTFERGSFKERSCEVVLKFPSGLG